jgi:AraC-like DNA-binding protein
MLRSFSTRNVPERTKIAYWNSLHCDLHTPMHIEPSDSRRFEADVSVGMIGPANIAEFVSRPATIERTNEHVARTKTHKYHFDVVVEGRSYLTHCGREIVLDESDFALVSTGSPGRFVLEGSNRMVSIAVPAELVRRHIPFIEDICGLHMAGHAGLNHVVSTMITSIWRQADSGFPARAGLNALKALLDMAAASYEACYEVEGIEPRRMHRRATELKKFIETNLRDHRLSPSAIADHFDISTRYVHTIFSKQGETVSSYILRRRIEECAHALAGRTLNHKTITDIAFDWGFNNTAHFTRVFKQHVGQSPREFRKQAVMVSTDAANYVSAGKVGVPS